MPQPFLYCGILLVLLMACSGLEKEAQPVPDSVMVDVMAGLHLAGARTALISDLPEGIRDTVLARHGLDSQRYAEALQYFAGRPQEFTALYGEVIERLSAESARELE